jgi:mannan endo-1,4-beta-mannosidase
MKSNLLLSILFLLFAGTLFSQTIDKKATKETVALFKNLKELSKNHTLFAHQHAIEYGHGWSGDENRSDVKSVCGSHPAMIGVDFSGFSGRPQEAVEREKEKLKKMWLIPTIVEVLPLLHGILIILFRREDFTGKTVFRCLL